jgi:hypothetical protein
MAGVTLFVVSVLGQDIFWNGAGDLTPDISSAASYEKFSEAELALMDCQGAHARAYGPSGFEIRTMLSFR